MTYQTVRIDAESAEMATDDSWIVGVTELSAGYYRIGGTS